MVVWLSCHDMFMITNKQPRTRTCAENPRARRNNSYQCGNGAISYPDGKPNHVMELVEVAWESTRATRAGRPTRDAKSYFHGKPCFMNKLHSPAGTEGPCAGARERAKTRTSAEKPGRFPKVVPLPKPMRTQLVPWPKKVVLLRKKGAPAASSRTSAERSARRNRANSHLDGNAGASRRATRTAAEGTRTNTERTRTNTEKRCATRPVAYSGRQVP